ncbi:uncharacterized protein LOC125018035 isoform X2 [Mugil cephalus]|uniref:uncharacterized protein LOC125018035 isoform X2 n=1 Tax=Mugil cephalus TaxID=48193 RepID=UPI001FB7B018|nr:uncharacterized protein LOC125018035 isoform X2 [Mugil cephalus]
MDSSPVLRQQSQNKIRNDFLRMKNEHNKKHPDPKSSKLASAPHLSSKDSENKDPGSSDHGWKALVRPGVSRLPVLAKSIHLQTPSDFSQSHCRWEEKPLAGKSKKKKPCTRPVPFNLSQPKSTRMATKDQQPLSVQQPKTHATQPENSLFSSKTTKHPVVLNSNADSTKGMGRSHGKMTENMSHLPGQSGPSNNFKTSTTLSNPLSSIANNTMHQNNTASSVPPALGVAGADVCLDNMNLLSLKDASQTAQLSAQSSSSKALTDKGENFPTDHAALLSVLQNKGVTAMASTTPQSKPYNSLPQRVPATKTRQKAAPSTVSGKSLEFSPDPAALQSILQNEGVKAGRVTAATPRSSVCPPGRGTSIYRAQRVPVRKNRAESTGGPVVALKEIKWTPQRVPNTRHQPMSAMKWHMSTKQYSTPGRRGCKSNVQLQQEEVVQRLFDDQEDERSTNVTDKDSGAQAEQLPVDASTAKSHREEKVEESEASSDEEEEEEEEEEKFVGGQMFLQAPHRESVIFFSTGKKLIRAPRVEKPEAPQHRHGPVSSEQRRFVPAQDDSSAEAEPSCQVNPCVQRLHRDVIVQKTTSLSPAVAMLRKRLPPLEELRMDEEVATYTSLSGPAPPRFLPPPPRCGNPLASVLYFEESTRFVPIAFDASSGPFSPLSSPLQER